MCTWVKSPNYPAVASSLASRPVGLGRCIKGEEGLIREKTLIANPVMTEQDMEYRRWPLQTHHHWLMVVSPIVEGNC